MGFGMLALPKVIREASESERRELEDYTCFALEKTLTGFFPAEAYDDMGFSAAEMQEIRRYRRETAASNDYAPFRKYFRRDMHGSMVANLARLGLLTDRRAERLQQLRKLSVAEVPQLAQLALHEEPVHEAAEGPERQPVGHAILDPRPAALLQEPVAVLPPRVGSPHLHVDEAERRIPLAHERAPAQRHDAEPAKAEVEDGPPRHGDAAIDQLQLEGRRRHALEEGRVGEEGEHLGTRARKPHARLEDMVGHGAPVIIGTCPASVKRARMSRCS
jgi:hypothetical protein